jgi:hypothetical protein
MRIYLPGDVVDAAHYPSILAIGDSWCWYPGNNLLQAIAQNARTRAPYKNIQIIGYNGAELAEYVTYDDVTGPHANEVERQLSKNFEQYYSAVVISGAGNDAIKYGLALKSNCNGIDDADQCLDAAGIGGLLERVRGCMKVLLDQVEAAFAHRKPHQPVYVFLHGYDYPVPDGRGFTLGGVVTLTGPWLQPALEKAGVDPSIRQDVCRRLIDRLNDTISAFHDPAKRIHFINSRGVLDSSPANYKTDWHNEMHPTLAGFNKVVESRWIPVLSNLGFAN